MNQNGWEPLFYIFSCNLAFIGAKKDVKIERGFLQKRLVVAFLGIFVEFYFLSQIKGLLFEYKKALIYWDDFDFDTTSSLGNLRNGIDKQGEKEEKRDKTSSNKQ